MKLKELREVLKYLQDKDSDVLIKDNKDLLQYIQVLKKKGVNDEWIYIVLQTDYSGTRTIINHGVMWNGTLRK